MGLGAGTTLGSYCILNTQATSRYDAVMKDFVQVEEGGIVGRELPLTNVCLLLEQILLLLQAWK
jgi:hypothetical protein